jgi:hypothetical protein
MERPDKATLFTQNGITHGVVQTRAKHRFGIGEYSSLSADGGRWLLCQSRQERVSARHFGITPPPWATSAAWGDAFKPYFATPLCAPFAPHINQPSSLSSPVSKQKMLPVFVET